MKDYSIVIAVIENYENGNHHDVIEQIDAYDPNPLQFFIDLDKHLIGDASNSNDYGASWGRIARLYRSILHLYARTKMLD